MFRKAPTNTFAASRSCALWPATFRSAHIPGCTTCLRSIRNSAKARTRSLIRKATNARLIWRSRSSTAGWRNRRRPAHSRVFGEEKPARSILVGTSGWHYKHWKGPFYPVHLPQDQFLSFYTEHFDTVELNTTFYRLPPPLAPNRWKNSTPPDFCFAAKGSRFLTHMKKLRDAEAGLENFFERIHGLGRKLGPIVFQLP